MLASRKEVGTEIFSANYLYVCVSHRFGTCSQICEPKKSNNGTCYCDTNYDMFISGKKRLSCLAKGSRPYLLVAEDNNLVRLNLDQQSNNVGSAHLYEVR